MTLRRSLLVAALALGSATAFAQATLPPLKFGVGLFQPDRERNDATYRPLAQHLARQLGRPVELRTVDTWEGLAKSLASGETDVALLGPWGYVLAHEMSGAEVVATILYDGKPEYFALIVTSPESGLTSAQDLITQGKGRTFAFGDKGSTSGYLIPLNFFLQQGIDPEKHFGRVVHTKHQAIEMQVAAGQIDAGADYNRNRDTMIAEGQLKAERSRIIWTSAPLPNDAVAVSATLKKDTAFVARLRAALVAVDAPTVLPPRYTGFVASDNAFYKPIRDAGLATGKLTPR